MAWTPAGNKQPTGAGSGDSSELDASVYRIAYQEALRRLEDQMAELDSMRQRSLQFLAFVGATTGFLMAAGLKNPERDSFYYALASVSTLLSLAAVALAILILLGIRFGQNPTVQSAARPESECITTRGKKPWTAKTGDWQFFCDPKVLVEQVIEPEPGLRSEALFLRRMALDHAVRSTFNARGLTAVRRRYRFFLMAAAGQLIGWTTLVWVYA